jgi:hypothetical protein
VISGRRAYVFLGSSIATHADPKNRPIRMGRSACGEERIRDLTLPIRTVLRAR